MKAVLSILCVTIGGALFKCTDVDQISKARVKADAVICNLGSEQAYLDFPEKNFSREEIKRYFTGFGHNCDYKSRKGRLIDSYFERGKSSDNISFIYEFFLKCDSLRFILKFELKDDPTLVAFRVEPIEQYNPMVLDPSKSLIDARKEKDQ